MSHLNVFKVCLFAGEVQVLIENVFPYEDCGNLANGILFWMNPCICIQN